uniref:EGF-like domain-containing protein n=1 Tax=Strongyloides papillosus TaxID=174720 RepID=A0A0N5BAE5_STREA
MESGIIVPSVGIEDEGTFSSSFHSIEKEIIINKDAMKTNAKVSENPIQDDKEIIHKDTPLKNRELLIKGRRKRGKLRELINSSKKMYHQENQQLRNFNEDATSISEEKVSISNLIDKRSDKSIIFNSTNDTLNSSVNISDRNMEEMVEETNFNKISSDNINKPKLVNIFEDEQVKKEERIEKEIARKHTDVIFSNINNPKSPKHLDILRTMKNNSTVSTTPKSNVTPTSTTVRSPTDFISGIGNLFSAFGKGIGKFIGFEKDCKNKGYKDGTGRCVCPPFHFGSYCEQVNCANGGKLFPPSKSNPRKLQCICPNPEFINGEFCQYIKCLNGGTPVDGEGRCSCNNNWYSGNFCENYSASWTIVFVIPIIILIIVTFLCAICRLDLCPKRNAYIHESSAINSGRRRRRRRDNLNENYSNNLVSRLPPLDGEERERMVTEHFLNQCRMQRYISTATNTGGNNLSNQNSLTNFLSTDDSVKMLEPPPSYQEALSASPAPPLPVDITTAPRPPAYQTIDPNRRRPSNS